MAWILLFAAGFFEILWALGLKLSEGFTKPVAAIGTIAAMGLSMGFMAYSLKTIPMGTAYAVWTGIAPFMHRPHNSRDSRTQAHI